MNVKIKKRKQQRINLTDYIAIFAEDTCNYTGTLKEISLNGLRVNICPAGSQLMASSPCLRDYKPSTWHNRKFRIVISENMVGRKGRAVSFFGLKNKIYIVTAYPRWQRKNNDLMEVGFEIPETSADWKLFVQQKMSEPDEVEDIIS
ncbi:MAG: hypothetical protein D3914_06515 [Candidatus Electrothrix sp. LOE2]|nr:hypothetical protein [Candidatus Electrothrix sp. LOE2]